MITSLDHVAIAVPDLRAAIERFANDMGLQLRGTEDVLKAHTTTAFFLVTSAEHPASIEIVAPLHGQGPLVKHLQKRGPGLHHLCFRTTDIVADVASLRAKGYRFITEQPQAGAHGTTIIFIHPKSTGGVLIELAQHPEPR